MLGKAATKLIHKAVDELFDRLKTRFLGPKLLDKRLAIGHREDLTLPGLYQAAAKSHGAVPDPTSEHAILNVAEGYIEAQRERAKAQVTNGVNAFLQDAEQRGVETNVATVLGGKLSETFESITNDVKRIVDAEAQNGRAMGTKEGIVKINESKGIDDPVVFFIVVRDNALCDECKRLHLLDDKVTPRCWFLSEVGNGYHRKGEPNPKVSGLHPHCRCTMATLMPGWGFDNGGAVTYVSPDWNEIEEQRRTTKSEDLDEFIEALAKHMDEGCPLHVHEEPLVKSEDFSALDDFIRSLA